MLVQKAGQYADDTLLTGKLLVVNVENCSIAMSNGLLLDFS